MYVSPLAGAILKGDENEFLDLLTVHDINERDKSGLTPLHHCLFNKKEELAMQCLGLQCDINAKDKRGNTPLHVAALRASITITQAIL